jgi:hypothetical protein
MMKISKELRERIRRLEMEQERQSQELQGLSDLRDMVAIAELEQELADISKTPPRQKAAAQASADIDLTTTEADILAKQAAGVHIEGPDLRTDKDIDLARESLPGKKPATERQGFVVCLLFNPASPSEWSEEGGGGWRGKGMGTPYPDKNAAAKKYKALKTKWPDYPIEIRRI